MAQGNKKAKAALEIAGIISVVASLLFVGLEIQQNSSVARVQSQQSTAELFSSVFTIMAENPELAELVISVNTGRLPLEELNREQSSTLYFINLLFLQAGQSAYYSAESGIANVEDIAGMTEGNLINPYVYSRWDALKQNLDKPYAEYLESITDL